MMMSLLGGGVSDKYLRSLFEIEDDIFWAKLQEFKTKYADKPPSSKEYLDEISSLIISGFKEMIETNDEIARDDVQEEKKDKALICRSVPEIESDIYWVNMKDLVEEMVQVKRNSEKKSPTEFLDEFSDIMWRAFKLAIGRKATVARTAHALSEARKKNKVASLIRGSDIWMDEKMGEAEIADNFKIYVLEEFTEEYRDALDTVRAELAPYFPNHHQQPPPPLVPPPIPAGVAYDNDYDAFKKRRDELISCQRQLNIYEKRQNDAIFDHLVLFDERVFFVLDVLSYRISRASEFLRINWGLSRYMDKETLEQHMRFINDNREALKIAGFDPNGYPIKPQKVCHRACSAA